jgi:hypothetical protein
MLTKVIPVTTTRITEENLPFDKVSPNRYGRIGFKKHSDSQKFSYEEQSATSSQTVSCQPSEDRRHRKARTQCN